MPAIIIVTLHIPFCGMHEMLQVNKTIFVYGFVQVIYSLCGNSVMYILMAFKCHFYLNLFCICMNLYFDYFLFLALQLLLI